MIVMGLDSGMPHFSFPELGFLAAGAATLSPTGSVQAG